MTLAGLAAWANAALARAGRAIGLTPDRAGLVRLACCLLLLYVAFTTYPDRSQRALRHAYAWVGVLAFLFLFGRGFQQVRALDDAGTRCTGVLVAGFAAFAAAALFIPAWHSSDLHAYVNVGWIQHRYDANPYVTVPADLPGWDADPMFDGRWKDVPCTYGFLYASTCRALAALGGGDPALTRLVFRLFSVLVIGAGAWLLASTLRGRGARWRVPLYLFLWNPYVLLHFVGNAHNDLLMALCLLLGFRFALDGRWATVVPALVVGLLVKHVAAVAIPFAVVWLVRRHGWGKAALGTLFGLAFVVPAAWPYAGAWSEFRWDVILDRLTSPWNSIQGAVGTLYEWLAALLPALAGSVDGFRDVLRVLFGLAFLTFAVHRFLGAARRREYAARDVVADSLVTLFALLCVFSSAWLPWYLGMFLPAVFLLPEAHAVRRLTLWIAAFQMLAFTGIGKARVLQAAVTLVLPMALYARLARRQAQREPGVS